MKTPEFGSSEEFKDPTGRRKFLENLAAIGGGVVLMGGGYWLAEETAKEWDRVIDRICRQTYNEPDCKKTDPELYEAVKEETDDLVLTVAPGIAGMGLGFLTTVVGITGVIGYIRRRRLT
ncbi:hypothetical protein HYU95_03770 [Candidatus Daviesbacteria bacterium]|nr:hypothetical protein [Candidatus Daviesbacteria bacterium]